MILCSSSTFQEKQVVASNLVQKAAISASPVVSWLPSPSRPLDLDRCPPEPWIADGLDVSFFPMQGSAYL